MQLGNGFPKLDLTQYDDLAQSKPLDNADLGLVRVCLGSPNLASDYERLVRLNVDFISPPQTTRVDWPKSRFTSISMAHL